MMAQAYKILFRITLILFLIQSVIYAQGQKFVHVATSSNIFLNWTVIDHPSLNGNPDAVLFVTQNWNPGGSGGVYNEAVTGVWYDGSNWAIFNQDITPIPEGASFNVFVHSGSGDFVHTASASNITNNWTNIDHPSLNGNPDAVFLVTQNWNPGGSGGVYDSSAIGVWYTGSNWAIFNQDLTAMPEGASFNVFIHDGADDLVHTATVSNIFSNWTVIDNPSLNGNPNAVFFVTQNWNPSGSGGVYNNAEIGVWYNGFNWSIFNQDISALPEGASFNIYLAESGVTDIENKEDFMLEEYSLYQNYPNPFNPYTVVRYQLPVTSIVTLKVYDILGNEVATLANEEKSAGSYEVEFDASGLSSGIYFYQLKAGSFVETKRMVLLK